MTSTVANKLNIILKGKLNYDICTLIAWEIDAYAYQQKLDWGTDNPNDWENLIGNWNEYIVADIPDRVLPSSRGPIINKFRRNLEDIIHNAWCDNEEYWAAIDDQELYWLEWEGADYWADVNFNATPDPNAEEEAQAREALLAEWNASI